MSSQRTDKGKSEEQSTGNQKARVAEKGTVRMELMLHGNPYPVREDEGPFTNFYLDKIASSMREKHPETYCELEKNNRDNLVTAVVWHNVTESQRNELKDALDWTLRKIDENRKAGV